MSATLPIKYVQPAERFHVISQAQRWRRMSADKANPVHIVYVGKDAIGYVQCSQKRAESISNRYGCAVVECPRSIA